jgi:hypothetical protein
MSLQQPQGLEGSMHLTAMPAGREVARFRMQLPAQHPQGGLLVGCAMVTAPVLSGFWTNSVRGTAVCLKPRLPRTRPSNSYLGVERDGSRVW